MKRWIVVGADKNTGEARTMSVTADLRRQVELIASRQGLLIESIDAEPDIDSAPQLPSNLHQPTDKKHSQIPLAISAFLGLVLIIGATFDVSAARPMLITALAIALMIAAFWIAGIPGRIARERQHPHAEAITICGYVGAAFFGVFWFVALIWAYAGQGSQSDSG